MKHASEVNYPRFSYLVCCCMSLFSTRVARKRSEYVGPFYIYATVSRLVDVVQKGPRSFGYSYGDEHDRSFHCR